MATPEDYIATFQAFKPGQAVLEDLVGRFHDGPVYVPGGPEGARETERRAARKEVIEYILRRLAQLDREHEGDGNA